MSDGIAASQEHCSRACFTVRSLTVPPMGMSVRSGPYLHRVDRNWLYRVRQPSHNHAMTVSGSRE